MVQDLIGPGKASELLFTAEYIDGKEAERIGLVNRAVPLDQLEGEVTRMARRRARSQLPSSTAVAIRNAITKTMIRADHCVAQTLV